MIKVNQDLYEAAQDYVREGRWTVDADLGLVTGTAGHPIGSLNHCGYLRSSVSHHGEARNVLLHRVVWESVNGPIGPSLYINHIDGVKTNNAIGNLELVTPKQNMAHAHATGLMAYIGPRGELAPSAKLTDSKVRQIKSRLANGESLSHLARTFGVEKSTISRIKNGTGWRHVA